MLELVDDSKKQLLFFFLWHQMVLRSDSYPKVFQGRQNDNFCWQFIPLYSNQWKEYIGMKKLSRQLLRVLGQFFKDFFSFPICVNEKKCIRIFKYILFDIMPIFRLFGDICQGRQLSLPDPLIFRILPANL